jgi:riboflavin biosynthesis pyrimidine reductase
MKPHVILHMASSIDGRIVPKRWPKELAAALSDIYERVHQDLKGDSWIVGRVTMADFRKGDPSPTTATEAFPRSTWKAPGAEQGPYAIALDRGAKLHLNVNRASGDPIVVVLTEAVPDDHVAELRRDGISYIFAGRAEIDLALALEILADEFGIRRLLLEGGGRINGSFLSEGLIDEISLLIIPVADGNAGLPTTFDRMPGEARSLHLQSVERLERDLLHLRYAVL